MRLRGGERILIRIPSWLGDAVMAEPTLRALRPWCADDAAGGVTLVGPKPLLELFEESLPGARHIATTAHQRAVLDDWRGHDVALLLTGSFRSAWQAFRAGIPERIGWRRDGRGLLLTQSAVPARESGGVPGGLGIRGRAPRWLPRHFGTNCVELLGLVGIPVREVRPRLRCSERARSELQERLASANFEPSRPICTINAGGRMDSSKSVAASIWSRAALELGRASELQFVIVAGPGEEARAEECGAQLPGSVVLTRPVLGLPELIALFERSRLVLTGDVGPRHVALAAGAKVVCVLGPTDPRHSADHLEGTRVVRRVVSCGPCHRERCPLDAPEQNRCLTEIEPERIAAAACELLGSSSESSPSPSSDHV